MDFDFDRFNPNKFYSTSPTSLSSSSSSSNSSMLTSNLATNKLSCSLKKQPMHNNMTSSSSQIFATAASFNLCQNDTVYYSRETIHLLAKFLSLNGDNNIYRSLYAYAPDNLAWFWSFFDWDTPIDTNQIATQEQFMPFIPVENLVIDDAQLLEVNKLFLDAPLIQYKYREPIMIADVYKFIEHVSKIEQSVVAKALFLLYFPRFSYYVSNPLKNLIQTRLLKSNLNLIKRIDDTIISLVKTRYTNLAEYKEKIERGVSLPSYIRTLLNENGKYTEPIATSHIQQHQSQMREDVKEPLAGSPSLLYSPFLSQKLANMSLTEQVSSNTQAQQLSKKDNRTPKINQQATVFFPMENTIDYMKLLEESNKINDDLDHVSFDSKKSLLSAKLSSQLNESKDESSNHSSSASTMPSFVAPNTVFELNTSYDEDQNEYQNNIGEAKLSDEQDQHDVQVASKYLELICNNSQSPAHMKLAQQLLPTLTLPQISHLNTLTESLLLSGTDTNNSSSLASPKTDASNNSFYYSQFNGASQAIESNRISYSHLPSQSYLNSSSCLSPSSPKISSKAMFPTPKTPSNLSQYKENSTNSMSDYSVWPNSTTSTKSTLQNNTNFYNSMTNSRFCSSNSVTPPPSASFKTTPLSVLTSNNSNDIDVLSKANSPAVNADLNSSCSATTPSSIFNKNLSKLNEPLTLNASMMQDEQLNNYLKHQFYGSPVTRVNKFNDYASNKLNKSLTNAKTPETYHSQANSYINYSPNLNQKAQRFASSSDFNNNNLFFRNEEASSIKPQHSPISKVSFSNSENNYSYRSSNNSQQHTWSGRLPPKTYAENSVYSRKVFLGGLPWDVNQHYLVQLLQKYGSVKLEIPGKDAKHPRVSNICKSQERSTPGYVYIIYEHESAVQRMLADCRKEIKNGGEHYYYTIFIPSSNNSNSNHYFNNFSSNNKRGKAKEVEVIPWNQEDTSYVPQCKTSILPSKIDAKSTIFVGALHGMLNAQGLAKVMDEIFGDVIHAGLDTDKYKYPIGSGRVTFRNRASYVKAIKSKFVTIKANLDSSDPSPKFEKTIQIDPYLEDAKCFKCSNRSSYFCRNENCLDYYCENCWRSNHDMIGNGEHLSLSRQNKPNHG